MNPSSIQKIVFGVSIFAIVALTVFTLTDLTVEAYRAYETSLIRVKKPVAFSQNARFSQVINLPDVMQ